METMSQVKGYGVYVENVELRDDANETLMSMISFDKNIKEEWKEFLEKNREEGESDLDIFTFFVDQYENIEYGWEGFFGLFCDLINGGKFNSENVFLFDDYIVFVAATLPETRESRIVSIEEIQEIIDKYLNPMFKRPVKCKWYAVNRHESL